MVNNDKPNLTANTHANENYARELMQLFTLGLYQLNETARSTGRQQQSDSDLRAEYGAGVRARVHGVDLSHAAGQQLANAQPGVLARSDGGAGQQSRHDGEDGAGRRDASGGPDGRAGPKGRAGQYLQPSERGSFRLQAAYPAPGDEQSQPRLCPAGGNVFASGSFSEFRLTGSAGTCKR